MRESSEARRQRILAVTASRGTVTVSDLAEELEPSLKTVWPRETRFEKRCYSLLRDAYIKARYSRAYRITEEELDWIAQRVALLQGLVREACESRIETLAKAA